MKLSTKILDMMIHNNLGPVIVGPYKNISTIQAKSAGYNRTHDIEVRLSQSQVMVVDAKTVHTWRMWMVFVVETRHVPKGYPWNNRKGNGRGKGGGRRKKTFLQYYIEGIVKG